MSKPINIFMILLTLTLINACHGAQRRYAFIADMNNSCDYPIHIFANSNNYTNDNISTTINPGEEINILDMEAHKANIEKLKNPSFIYSIEISDDKNTKTLDWNQLLKILKNSEKTRNGGITTWTIKDPSLCPSPQDSTQ